MVCTGGDEMVEYKEIPEREWEKYPPPTPPRPPNQWDEVLGVLEGGKIVELAVPEEKIRGTRIGLARSASTRGFKLEFRYQNGKLAVRRSEKPLPPREPKERKPRAKKKVIEEEE
jgi:hypothetical protein